MNAILPDIHPDVVVATAAGVAPKTKGTKNPSLPVSWFCFLLVLQKTTSCGWCGRKFSLVETELIARGHRGAKEPPATAARKERELSPPPAREWLQFKGIRALSALALLSFL